MFIDVVNQLLEKRRIRKSVLARECLIPYTTVVGWYDRKCNGVNFSHLIKLSDYFNVSIDYLIKGIQEEYTKIPISEFEERFIAFYRSKSKDDQKIIESFMNYLILRKG